MLRVASLFAGASLCSKYCNQEDYLCDELLARKTLQEFPVSHNAISLCPDCPDSYFTLSSWHQGRDSHPLTTTLRFLLRAFPSMSDHVGGHMDAAVLISSRTSPERVFCLETHANFMKFKVTPTFLGSGCGATDTCFGIRPAWCSSQARALFPIIQMRRMMSRAVQSVV